MSFFGSSDRKVNQKLFAVFDVKSRIYGTPFIAHTEEDAKRAFMDGIKSKQGLLGMHPEDHSLVCLGEYDVHTGELVPGKSELIVTGLTISAVLSSQEKS